MHTEYTKTQPVAASPDANKKLTDPTASDKTAAKPKCFKLLKRPGAGGDKIISASHNEPIAGSLEAQLDPDAKKKVYEETRARLFSPEELKSCDSVEDDDDEKPEKTTPPSKKPEEYDLDYDRFLPLFLSQSMMEPDILQQPVLPQPNYYDPRFYDAGGYAPVQPQYAQPPLQSPLQPSYYPMYYGMPGGNSMGQQYYTPK